MDASGNLGWISLAVSEKYIAGLSREPFEQALIDQEIRSDHQTPSVKLSACVSQHFPRVGTLCGNEFDFLHHPTRGQGDYKLRRF
jgi:hypothetical protein